MWTCTFWSFIFLAPWEVSLNTRAEDITNGTKLQPVYNFGRNFLGLDKCNACIGTSLCNKLFKEEIRFENWLSADLKLPPSHRNTYFANYSVDAETWKAVVISRLQSNYQNELSDRKICLSAAKKIGCSIENVLRATERFQKWLAADRLTAELVQTLPSPLLRCPSQRLLDRIVRRYAEVRDSGSVLMRHFTDRDKLRLLYTLSVNTHPLVLQNNDSLRFRVYIYTNDRQCMPGRSSKFAFTHGIEGWPFVRYFGSCGRLMVTPWTKPIKEFYNASPEDTADVAYQLLQITHLLGNNDLNYFMYYTSVHDNMFGIFEDERLYIIDTSTIGIIDKLEDKELVHGKKDIFSCLTSDCKTDFAPCGNINEALSFTKVCRDLLPHLVVGKFTSSPTVQNQIDRYLGLCGDEMLSTKVVLEAAGSLIELLKSLRSCEPRFEYRYPECKYNKDY